MNDRRGFFGSVLALICAPFAVRALPPLPSHTYTTGTYRQAKAATYDLFLENGRVVAVPWTDDWTRSEPLTVRSGVGDRRFRRDATGGLYQGTVRTSDLSSVRMYDKKHALAGWFDGL